LILSDDVEIRSPRDAGGRSEIAHGSHGTQGGANVPTDSLGPVTVVLVTPILDLRSVDAALDRICASMAVAASAPASSSSASSRVSVRQAIVTGWLLCGVLDITAAFVQSWMQAGRPPAAVLKGIASALWGRAALDGGAGMATIGLFMHFTVALTATLVFYGLSRRIAFLRTAPLLVVGPLYGVVVFATMNYGTIPLLSWVRSVYLGTPPRWPGSMGPTMLVIHLICVGLPIVWSVRRAPGDPPSAAR
jgi:hypothetical protein